MKRTRLKVTIGVIIYLGVVGLLALLLKYPQVTMFCVTGITGSGLMYKHVETKRKSIKDE